MVDLSPADLISEELTRAAWAAYEEERELFLIEKRQRNRGGHGTTYRYNKLGCRCSECRAASAAHQKVMRRRRGVPERKKATHGSYTMYKKHGCKCAPCKIAGRNWRIAKGIQQPWVKKIKPEHHGTRNGYNHYGCRCEACREAEREHGRQLRARKAALTERQKQRRIAQ